MLTIFKYPFEITDEFSLAMPQSSQILSVQYQDDQPVFWAIVDTEAPVVIKYFCIFGTGHLMPVESQLEYKGTIQNNSLVWHIFEDILRGPR